MSRSDPPPVEDVRNRRVRAVADWRAWLLVAWASWFGILYGMMILESRAPAVVAKVRSALFGR